MISSMGAGIVYFIGRAYESIDRATEPQDDEDIIDAEYDELFESQYKEAAEELRAKYEEMPDFDESLQDYFEVLEMEERERDDRQVN